MQTLHRLPVSDAERKYVENIAKQSMTTEEQSNNIPSVTEYLGIKENEGPIGIQCKRCKKHGVRYQMVARRSADEGMVAIAHCTHCKIQYTIH